MASPSVRAPSWPWPVISGRPLPSARFGVPAAKLGLMVDQWTIRRLVGLVGQSAARDLLLSADPITGERAHALGFVQRLGGVDEALQWAERIAALAPLTLAGPEGRPQRGRRRRRRHAGVRRRLRPGLGLGRPRRGAAGLRREANPRLRGPLSPAPAGPGPALRRALRFSGRCGSTSPAAQRALACAVDVSGPAGSNTTQAIWRRPRSHSSRVGRIHPTSNADSS